MLDCIKKLKHRKRPEPKKDKHCWKAHQPQFFRKSGDPIAGYDQENRFAIIKKLQRKDNRGQRVFAC